VTGIPGLELELSPTAGDMGSGDGFFVESGGTWKVKLDHANDNMVSFFQ